MLKRFHWTDAELHKARSLKTSTGAFPTPSCLSNSRDLSGITMGAMTTWKVRFGSKAVEGWYEDEILHFFDAYIDDGSTLGFLK